MGGMTMTPNAESVCWTTRKDRVGNTEHVAMIDGVEVYIEKHVGSNGRPSQWVVVRRSPGGEAVIGRARTLAEAKALAS